MNAGGTGRAASGEQELRLTHLDLSHQQLQWHEAPRYRRQPSGMARLTTVKGVKLVSGEQQITAEGTFGHQVRRMSRSRSASKA